MNVILTMKQLNHAMLWLASRMPRYEDDGLFAVQGIFPFPSVARLMPIDDVMSVYLAPALISAWNKKSDCPVMLSYPPDYIDADVCRYEDIFSRVVSCYNIEVDQTCFRFDIIIDPEGAAP